MHRGVFLRRPIFCVVDSVFVLRILREKTFGEKPEGFLYKRDIIKK